MSNIKTALKNGYADGYAYFGLAKIYRAQGNNTKASENYEKAISLEPDRTAYSAEYSDFISSLYSPKVVSTTVQPKEIKSVSVVEEPSAQTETPVKTVEPKDNDKDKEAVVPVVKISEITMKQNEDLIEEGDKNFKNNNYEAAIKN